MRRKGNGTGLNSRSDFGHGSRAAPIAGGRGRLVFLPKVQHARGHSTIRMACRCAYLAPAYQLAVLERLCDNDP